MQIQLSPLNLFGIKAQLAKLPEEDYEAGQVKRVTMYRCPECLELHEDEDDAESCCATQKSSTTCPVCGQDYNSHRDAADCCLWKDIDALTRWQIADAVEAGSTWEIELGVIAK